MPTLSATITVPLSRFISIILRYLKYSSLIPSKNTISNFSWNFDIIFNASPTKSFTLFARAASSMFFLAMLADPLFLLVRCCSLVLQNIHIMFQFQESFWVYNLESLPLGRTYRWPGFFFSQSFQSF